MYLSYLMKPKILLVLICLFFLITRLYKISEIPASVYWDEASIGYNAYSIAQTGKDEWGKVLPLHFKAFGETKLPIYIYIVSLSIKIFGLNEFAIRLPVVIFSLITVIVIFLLARKITNNSYVGLLSSFLATISPWLFIFSRTGYEAIIGLCFFLLGVFLYLCYKRGSYFLIISSIFFIFSAYSYNAFRILYILILPVLIFYTIYFYRNHFTKVLPGIVIALSLTFFSLLPIITSFDKLGSSRLEAVGIFNGNKKTTEIVKQFIVNYSKHLDPKFLFFKGDINLRSQQKDFGQLYLLNAPFFIIGIVTLLRKKSFSAGLPIYILLISIIPAAITKESPHALRSLAALPFIEIISSVGISTVYKKINPKFKDLFNWTLIIVFLVLFLNYFSTFIITYNRQTYNDWQYGYKKIFQDYSTKFSDYDHVIISDRYNQPYIFALFYLKYNPDRFRAEVKYNKSIRKETSLVSSFSNFIFTDIDYYKLPKGKNLIFTTPTDKMDEIKPKEVILNPDNSTSVYLYEYEK